MDMYILNSVYTSFKDFKTKTDWHLLGMIEFFISTRSLINFYAFVKKDIST